MSEVIEETEDAAIWEESVVGQEALVAEENTATKTPAPPADRPKSTSKNNKKKTEPSRQALQGNLRQ
ncbi:MAG: hypothetical protein COA94_07535 [Rickettsiales bacterium]|nr:MAG: hypothetical protein COA94_07535 [Rickettsiales bacterium]